METADTQTVLMQVLFVTAPIMVIQAFQRNTPGKSRQRLVLLGVFSVLSIVLCMVFSLKTDAGIIVDLRTTPWLAVFLYIGNTAGVLVTLFMLIVRFLIGGMGFHATWITYTIGILLLQLILPKFRRAGILGKLGLSAGCSAVISLILIVLLQLIAREPLSMEAVNFHLYYTAMNMFSTLLMIQLMESSRERTVLHHELRRFEELHMVGQMAASIAHEIRNPLTVIKGFLQLFESSAELSEEKRKEYTHLLLKEVTRAEIVINDYLALAKVKPELNEEINVTEELHAVIGILAAMAMMNHIELVVAGDNGPLWIKGSKQKFKQVLVNVIKNAIEASAAGKAVKVQAYPQNRHIIITIADEGIGMTKEQLAGIGAAFQSSKEIGTGLGLTVCYEIIEEMHGEITVQSTLGKGTTFKIAVPAIRYAA